MLPVRISLAHRIFQSSLYEWKVVISEAAFGFNTGAKKEDRWVDTHRSQLHWAELSRNKRTTHHIRGHFAHL